MNELRTFRPSRAVKALLALALSAATPAACIAQTPDALDWKGKLHYHAAATYDPSAIAGFAAYAGILQGLDSPTEWGRGGDGYGERFASTVGWSVIHSSLAFGLDSTLHQDPRYFRTGGTGFWRRAGHAVRGTILTRTDAGGETFSTWRFGSAYGAAFLSDLWYPARLDTARHGFVSGSLTLGFDVVRNLASEFSPDIKRKLFHRK